ncbi:acyltransferase [Streptomyces roseoverticillatus]|uniref:acyltransferase family protein n=1 Tax=Streptomyces roseoverticillatus TaxID=66429 RepID=UPI001F35582E|nr:acyltransferase [Streptomyces roseoverticillatus]MCF3106233.1 acyltransferase [Streptomyces roseoverticillatus]
MRFASRGDLDGGLVAGQKPAAPRLYVLDGLRIVAALMVVFFHYVALRGGWGQDPEHIFPNLWKFAQYGWTGVEIFFLISGFVICMSTWGRSLGDFFISRVSRVYPAYWVAILLTAAVVTLWPQVRQINGGFDGVLTNLTMLQSGLGVWDVDGVYWTLFIELKFYVMFAVVVATGVTYRKCVLFCVLWTVVALASVQADIKVLDQWAMPLYQPYFVAGIAFYLMYRYRPNALLWGITAMSLLLAEHHITRRVADNTTHNIPAWPARVIVLVAFVLMALIACGKFNRIQWRWLSTAGALTYPLYLLHQYIGMTVIYGLRDRIPRHVLVIGLVLVMLGAAWLLHKLVERPLGMRLRKVLRSSMEEVRQHSPRRGAAPASPGSSQGAPQGAPQGASQVPEQHAGREEVREGAVAQRLRAYETGTYEQPAGDRVAVGRPDGA